MEPFAGASLSRSECPGPSVGTQGAFEATSVPPPGAVNTILSTSGKTYIKLWELDSYRWDDVTQTGMISEQSRNVPAQILGGDWGR